MAKDDPKWEEKVAKVMQKGALHRMLGVPVGTKIPLNKLIKAAHSHNPVEKRRAILAENMSGRGK